MSSRVEERGDDLEAKYGHEVAERAAIYEFEAGMDRITAERKAKADYYHQIVEKKDPLTQEAVERVIAAFVECKD